MRKLIPLPIHFSGGVSMRYLIGIDAAKAKNDIAIFNSDLGLVRKPFTISQSQSDI